MSNSKISKTLEQFVHSGMMREISNLSRLDYMREKSRVSNLFEYIIDLMDVLDKKPSCGRLGNAETGMYLCKIVSRFERIFNYVLTCSRYNRMLNDRRMKLEKSIGKVILDDSHEYVSLRGIDTIVNKHMLNKFLLYDDRVVKNISTCVTLSKLVTAMLYGIEGAEIFCDKFTSLFASHKPTMDLIKQLYLKYFDKLERDESFFDKQDEMEITSLEYEIDCAEDSDEEEN
jgi:hypothetical protein